MNGGDRQRRMVEDFLYREARLADERRFSEWAQLWAPGEIRYWAPPRADTDPLREVCLIFDDRERLEQRVQRWTSGFDWAQDPPSLTRRILGNIEVTSPDEREVVASANVIICISRRARAELVAGRVTYRLEPDGDGFRLREKRVVLLDPDAPVGNLTFVL